ncbi:TIR domain-containing protein [Leisingera sp. ANG-M1]|uniref:TIR domain-containing protein n=1 Tax=Leisingera sp. ANG-M1 TaxID=1577895 RepID=UPI000690B941|nr:TIR domain-containing protein [Leisingera sp. ANG-M1]
MTNVFISWSGELSKQFAEELRKWIPSVLQFAKPYFTPNDIEKGTKWSAEISQKLSETNVGIVCLTRENFERPWILFEAGALSKDLGKSKVCSVLFGMEPTDLSGPLTTFQTTSFERSDFKKLMSSINDEGGENKLDKDTFDNVFDMWWPHLEKSIKKIFESKDVEKKEDLRSDREILEEILSLTRISARNPSSKSRGHHVSPGAIDHLLSVSFSVGKEAMNHKDYDLLSPARELVEIADYFISTLQIPESTVSRRMDEVTTFLAEVESKIADSDEIPF